MVHSKLKSLEMFNPMEVWWFSRISKDRCWLALQEMVIEIWTDGTSKAKQCDAYEERRSDIYLWPRLVENFVPDSVSAILLQNLIWQINLINCPINPQFTLPSFKVVNIRDLCSRSTRFFSKVSFSCSSINRESGLQPVGLSVASAIT